MAKRSAFYMRPLESRMMLDASMPFTTDAVLNLDASDSTTVSTNGTDQVTQWDNTGTANDQDRDAENLSAVADEGYATYDSMFNGGMGGIVFDNASSATSMAFARGDLDLGNAESTVFIVLDPDELDAGDPQSILTKDKSDTADTGLNIDYKNGEITYSRTDLSNDSDFTVSSPETGLQIVAFTGNPTDGYETFVNGLSLGTSSGSIGLDGLNSLGVNFQGTLGQIMVYDRELSGDEMQDVENYLADKWGLETALDPNNEDLVLANGSPSLYVETGETVTITDTDITINTKDNTESGVYIEIAALPSSGALTLNGNPLNVGDLVSVEEMQGDQLRYTHDGRGSMPDSFGFFATDLVYQTGLNTFTLSGPTMAIEPVETPRAETVDNTETPLPETASAPESSTESVSFPNEASVEEEGQSFPLNIDALEGVTAFGFETVLRENFDLIGAEVTTIEPLSPGYISSSLLRTSAPATGSLDALQSYYGNSLQAVRPMIESPGSLDAGETISVSTLDSLNEELADDAGLSDFLSQISDTGVESYGETESYNVENVDLPDVENTPAETPVPPEEMKEEKESENPQQTPPLPGAELASRDRVSEFTQKLNDKKGSFVSEVDSEIDKWSRLS